MSSLIRMTGVPRFEKAVRDIDKGMTKASRAAVLAAARRVKSKVRANLNGQPRWNHSGRTAIGPLTMIELPKHTPRSGGPGRFTGELREGVGIEPPKIGAAGELVCGVGVGGANKHPLNRIKGRWEAVYPFFAPGVAAAAAGFEAVYVAAYTKALKKYT